MRSILLSTASILASVLAGNAIAQPKAPVAGQILVPMPPMTTGRAPQTAPTTSVTAPVRPITIGQTISGTIGPEDAKLESDQSSYEVYRVQVPAGRRVTATLTSSAFQPVLGLGARITEDCEGCTIVVGETTRPAVASRSITSAGPLEFRVNTMNQGETGAFTLSVVATVPPALAAQPLTFGQSKTGALTPNDATSGDDNTLTDAYALRLAARQEVQIDLSSSVFDSKLELMSPDGGKVADDDDSGPGNSARIRFTAPRAGVYQVRAMALTDGGLGAYTLRAGARPAVVPMPPPRPLVLGTPTSGTISPTTPRYDNDGEETVAVRYSFNAQAGTNYKITATKRDGSTLDPKISVGKLVNGSLNSSSSDDDGGGDMNSALRFRPTDSGVYVLEVSPVSETMGAFDVKVSQSPPDRAPSNPVPVTLGTDYRGNLADGGARRSDDSLFTSYAVALKAGQRVTISMNKEGDTSLDPKLEIGRGTAAAFEQIAEDDDGGTDLNARLRFVSPSDATYIIRATAANASGEGAFVLKVVETPPQVTPPAPTPIQIGQLVQGALSVSDPSLNDETFYDRYAFSGQVGETYQISVEAEPFDVIVGARSSLREDDDYSTDDDSGGGTNAKLIYTITTAGPQTIRVTSVGQEGVGQYSLSIVKQ